VSIEFYSPVFRPLEANAEFHTRPPALIDIPVIPLTIGRFEPALECECPGNDVQRWAYKEIEFLLMAVNDGPLKISGNLLV
jgi:hypothetical protein